MGTIRWHLRKLLLKEDSGIEPKFHLTIWAIMLDKAGDQVSSREKFKVTKVKTENYSWVIPKWRKGKTGFLKSRFLGYEMKLKLMVAFCFELNNSAKDWQFFEVQALNGFRNRKYVCKVGKRWEEWAFIDMFCQKVCRNLSIHLNLGQAMHSDNCWHFLIDFFLQKILLQLLN